MSQIQLLVDGIQVYASGAATPPPAGSPPPVVPPPVPPPSPTPSGVTEIEIDGGWANPHRTLTGQHGGFALGSTIAVSFTTGSAVSGGNLCKIAGAEYQGDGLMREFCLSETPGDFDPAGKAWCAHGSNTPTVTVPFTVENPGAAIGFYPVLKRSTKYYLNVRYMPNMVSEGQMAFDLIKYDNQ